jgi:hypothetical protein
MLKAKIIQPSNSPYSSSIVLVPKPDGSKRVSIDYRKLNAITIADNFPMPRIQDNLDSLSGSKFFTTFDLFSGYFRTFIEPASIPKTAFTTANGNFEFLRTPFGLRNAPSQFSRFILNEHKLKLKKQKCKWFSKEIKLLGHKVSGGSVKMDTIKVKAILDRKPPTNKKQIQEFSGFPNYYRKFIFNFSEIALPISNLLKKDVPFVWSDDCVKEFDNLKKSVTHYPILQQPDFSRKFILHCDASGYALGVILCQINSSETNFLNTECVISYASYLLKGAEVNYEIAQKECLSIVKNDTLGVILVILD